MRKTPKKNPVIGGRSRENLTIKTPIVEQGVEAEDPNYLTKPVDTETYTEGHPRLILRVVHATVEGKEGIKGYPRLRPRLACETVKGKEVNNGMFFKIP